MPLHLRIKPHVLQMGWHRSLMVKTGTPTEARFLLTIIATQLSQAQIENPRRDANLILQMALQSDEPILMHHEITLDDAAHDRLNHLIEERKKGCPISRLRGSREFYSLNFALNAATLDPRPDSETLVDVAIKACADRPWHMADFGTGSGCLLISVLKHCGNATGIGLDIAAEGIALARENAKNNGVDDRAVFTVSDWDSALGTETRFDMILSNPPYIPLSDEASLSPEVRLYDPPTALYGGVSGLEAYERVMGLIAKRLVDKGIALIEIGQGQEDDVTKIGCDAGLRLDGHYADLAGIIRVLKFVKT